MSLLWCVMKYLTGPLLTFTRSAEVVLAKDVTEQKPPEEAQRQSEERYRSIFEGVRDIIYTISADGAFTSLNGEFERISGWSRGEWIGKSFAPLIHPEDLPMMEEAFASGVRGEPAVRFEVRIRKKSGGFISLELNSTRYLQGKVASVLGIARDVSERRQAEEEKAKLVLQLRHMQKMEALGTLTGGVAHDFNNILTAIQGFTKLALMQLGADSPQSRHLHQIVIATDKASALVRGLLAFSRRQPYAPKAVDVNDIVSGIANRLDRLIGEGIELSIRPAGERLVVMADAGQLEQVLMNLATNARDAMSGTGVLSIAACRTELDEQFVRRHGYGERGSYACLSISDTGAGMDAGTMERIFEPFFTTKEVGKGTGLGLSILYGIVKQHNGYVTVSSEVASGTTFQLLFPLTGAPCLTPTVHPLSAALPGTETILLVEDNDEVRRLFRELLQNAGYAVLDAKDGAEGAEKFSLNSDTVDLLVVDAIMPGKNGRELYRSVKRVRDDLPVLYLSGYSAGTGISAEEPECGEFFISKPVSPTDLLAKVREILERPMRSHRSDTEEPEQ